jgi:hypothetical protein
MSQILENQTLEMTNVLSRRGTFSQTELQVEMQKIGLLLKEKAVEKNGSVVTATFAIDVSGDMDIEILVPLNHAIFLPNGYTLKPNFKLTNAVKIRHAGNPVHLQKSAQDINAYIADNQLIPITVGYNVVVSEPKNPQDVENMIVDIYVGISPNIL